MPQIEPTDSPPTWWSEALGVIFVALFLTFVFMGADLPAMAGAR
jgi:hypothetical protein